jgi:hypothetical protein
VYPQHCVGNSKCWDVREIALRNAEWRFAFSNHQGTLHLESVAEEPAVLSAGMSFSKDDQEGRAKPDLLP